MNYIVGLLLLLLSCNLSAAAANEETFAIQLARTHLTLVLEQTLGKPSRTEFGYPMVLSDCEHIAELPQQIDQNAADYAQEIKSLVAFLNDNQLFKMYGKIDVRLLTAKQNIKRGSYLARLRQEGMMLLGAKRAQDAQKMPKGVYYGFIDFPMNRDLYGIPNKIRFDIHTPAFVLRFDTKEDLDLSTIDQAQRGFLEKNQEAIDLLKTANDITLVIDRRLNTLKNILARKVSPQETIDALLASEEFPSMLKPNLRKYRADSYRTPGIIKKIKEKFDQNMEEHEQRKKSIKKIFPADLEIALLYSFFLLEEAYSLKQADEHFDILSALSVSDESLSLKALFASKALDVLQALGFANFTDKEASEEEPKKKKKKKKAKAKNEEKPQQQEDIPLAPEDQQEDVPKPQGKDEEKSLLVDDIQTPPEEPQQQQGLLLNSLNLPSAKNMVLKRERGHRLLDIIARLVAYELFDGGSTAGTVALALVRPMGQDQLMIATKTDVEKRYIIEALERVLENSKLAFNSTANVSAALKDYQEKVREAQRKLGVSEEAYSHKNHRVFDENRFTAYRLKFHQLIKKPDQNDLLVKKIAALFRRGHLEKSVLVVRNPFGKHAELVVADQIRNFRLALGDFKTAFNQVIPYQYIGCSLLNCAMCDTVLRGQAGFLGYNDDENRILIFSRGKYDVIYPGFVVPEAFALQNRQSWAELRTRLNQLQLQGQRVPFVSTLSQDHLTACQNPAFSDSEEEKEEDDAGTN